MLRDLGTLCCKLKPAKGVTPLSVVSTRHASSLAHARRRQTKRKLREMGRKYDRYTADFMSDIKEGKQAPYEAVDHSISPLPDYRPQQEDPSGGESPPYTKPQNEPYPTAPFNEVSTEPLLVWNDFQERYELRDKRILSEKTKQTLLSIHRRDPVHNSRERMATKFGLSQSTIDFIFWEDEMRRKYKIPYDLDTIKLLEAYCGTDKLIESRAYAMMAYSEVTGDPQFASKGTMTSGNPLILHSDELQEHLYSWQKKQRHVPRLTRDHYELVPQQGAGSGKEIADSRRMRDTRASYLVVDVDDDDISQMQHRHLNCKVRETNGTMRWATVDECNYVQMHEYPNGLTPFNRIRKRYRKGMPKRKFARRPYIDHYYQESHWW